MKCQTYWILADQIASIRFADRQEVGSQISSRVAYQRASVREPSRHRAMQMMPRITQIFRSRITHIFRVVGTVHVHRVCGRVCVSQDFRGSFPRVGLASLKAVSRMWGSRLLWQYTFKLTSSSQRGSVTVFQPHYHSLLIHPGCSQRLFPLFVLTARMCEN